MYIYGYRAYHKLISTNPSNLGVPVKFRNALVSAATVGVLAPLSLVATAAPAQAHVSTCNIVSVGKPAIDRQSHMVGGVGGSFKCDAVGNHHSYVGMKASVQVMTMNLPGERYDRFQTISSSIMRANVKMPKISGSLNTLGWAMKGQNKTYRIEFEIAIVGPHGVIPKRAVGARTVGIA